jgi:hypothetical protein
MLRFFAYLIRREDLRELLSSHFFYFLRFFLRFFLLFFYVFTFFRGSGPSFFSWDFFLNLKSKKNASCFRAATEKAKKEKSKKRKQKKKKRKKKQKKNADCGYRGARPSGWWCVEVRASERGVGRGAGGGARV